MNDADFAIWRTYGVKGWPTVALIDPEGYIAGAVSGEGHYDVLDGAIGKIVAEHAEKGTLDRTPRRFRREAEESGPLSFPGKVAADAGRLFISDTHHHRIVVADLDGRVLETIGSGEAGLADGGFAEAQFHEPEGICIDGSLLYVADPENHAVRRVNLKRKRIETIAGTGTIGRARGRGAGREVALSSPWDLALDGDVLYIAMAGMHQVWTLDLGGGSVGPFAGSGREDIVDGELDDAAFAQPSGIALVGGRIYVADSEVSGVRVIDLAKGVVGTLVGEGLFEFGDADGVGTLARMQHPLGVAGGEGKLYVADSYNHKVKAIDLATRRVTTIAGDGNAGLVDGKAARFHEPTGLAFAGGRLYVADTNNHSIRVVELARGEVSTLPVG